MANKDYILNQDPNTQYHTKGLPTHDEYSNYIDRWQYLIRSYLGGAQYKMGRYLTRYVYETEGDFQNRLAQTPLDNHVKSVIHIWNSFLFRNEPTRDFGSLEGTPEIKNFLEDCDMEGRTWQSFMRDVNVMSSVYGHCVVLVDRPETVVGTRAEELEQGIRPYATIYTPENVLDWHWQRLPSGQYELQYVKFLEIEERTAQQTATYYCRTWTKDEITLEKYNSSHKEKLQFVESKPNPLGVIPAVWVYANRSPIRGIGVSDVHSIASMAMAIYNEWSECEQLIRLTNHPSLVKTPEVDAAAGAGAIITIPNETDAGLRPYLLQPGGQSIDGILKSINQKIEAIDRMAHLGSIRAIETRQMSGIAMQTEYTTLDAKLSEKAKNLQLAEEQIWRLFAAWTGDVFNGSVKYPISFNIRDKNMDMDILKKVSETAKNIALADPGTQVLVNKKIKEILAKDEDELEEFNKIKIQTVDPISNEETPQPQN